MHVSIRLKYQLSHLLLTVNKTNHSHSCLNESAKFKHVSLFINIGDIGSCVISARVGVEEN